MTPAIESALMFPIAGNENAKGEPADGQAIFKNAVDRGCLTGVPDDALAFIESEQPFRWGGGDDYHYHWLWTLHHLNRIDKHRRLALTTAWLDMPAISVPEGVTPRVKWWRAEGPVKDGDLLVTYSGAEAGVNAHFGRAIAIDEDVATRDIEILRCLVNVQDRVGWIVARLLLIDTAARP